MRVLIPRGVAPGWIISALQATWFAGAALTRALLLLPEISKLPSASDFAGRRAATHLRLKNAA